MRQKNVVTIGGGTGSFMLLSGLKKYPINLSAIVSMADDGGSTGVLRDELGVLPPGDVRQCLVALSDSTQTLRELMNYRFEKGTLKGHNFGNIFLSALEKISGNFADGAIEAAKILNVKGEVIPVANDDMRLCTRLRDGRVLKGENQLDDNKQIQKSGIEKIFLSSKTKAYPKAVDKIRSADFIIIGPGDLYGSILPNLLVGGIAEAIRKSKAKVIFNCNLTNKKGHTDDFDVDDYVTKINEYIGKDRIDFVTFNNKKPSAGLVRKYEKLEGASLVGCDKARKRNCQIIQADLLYRAKISFNESDLISSSRSFIRHDSDKLAKLIVMIFELGEYRNIIKGII